MRTAWFQGVLVLTLALTTNVAHGRPTKTKTDETAIRVVTESVPFETHYEFSRRVGPGRLLKAQEGQPGRVTRTYQVFFKDGKPYRKELLDEERTDAQPEIVLMGPSGYAQSRGGSFARAKVIEMEATAYDPSPQTIGRGATGRTATGMRADYGVVAVDPRVIPLGTLVFVEGYGFAIASDTGGAIKGRRIDLCYPSRSQSLAYGRKKVQVHVLKRRA
ncbi:MAG: G5 domain-containing protein [Fimbriimonadaceae bacterium]|nr:G5 domain-containing protein [Fimbriimonadaceae bacterium]